MVSFQEAAKAKPLSVGGATLFTSVTFARLRKKRSTPAQLHDTLAKASQT